MEYPHEKEILEFLKDKNLIVVSNRGPIEFQHNHDHIIMKRGAGGLVSTLMPLNGSIEWCVDCKCHDSWRC